MQLSNISDYIEIELTIHGSNGLHGGKGGFGSMLRAAGKISRTTNKQAMRDLSGRRNRFVKQEKDLRQWVQDQEIQAKDSEYKKPTNKEIQNDFRYIKKHGKEPEKRMCHRGAKCPYKYKCKFQHPINDQKAYETHDWKRRRLSKERNATEIYVQSDDQLRSALKMGKLFNERKMKFNKLVEIRMEKQMKLDLELFGNDDQLSSISSNDEREHVNENKNSAESNIVEEKDNRAIVSNEDGILFSEYHEHKLICVERKDCDFVICDHCDKEFVGSGFHCQLKACDFDICMDCAHLKLNEKQDESTVVIDENLLEGKNSKENKK